MNLIKYKKYIIYFGVSIFVLFFSIIFLKNSFRNNSVHNHNHKVFRENHQMWTCSMHPQIMQPESGNCPICGMALIPLEDSQEKTKLLLNQFKLSDKAVALANIKTFIVGNSISPVNNEVKLAGKISESERIQAVQVTYFSGRIESLNNIFTGKKVRKGDLLAVVYSPDLYAAQQELITAFKIKNKQPDLYKSIRNKLKLWKLSESQINQIESRGNAIENFLIYAKISGTITKKLVEEGSYIKQGQPLFKIVDLSTVWADFDIYENQLSWFREGQKITITAHAYPNKKFETKVDFIDPILNMTTRVLKLRAVLKNNEGLLKPGMFVKGKIQSLLNKDNGVVIPSSSVLWTGKRSIVYLKPNPEVPVFEIRQVVLADQIAENYRVLEGLDKGDEIVVNGTFTVDAVAQLQGKKSMMNNTSFRKKSFESTIEFQNQLNLFFEIYILLKDALIEENQVNILASADSLTEMIRYVRKDVIPDNALDYWLEIKEKVVFFSNKIIKTSDLEDQRSSFKNLSKNFSKIVQSFGVHKKVYYQFCPMADKGRGAYWLSKERQVLNPYFGSSMLYCGEVKEVFE